MEEIITSEQPTQSAPAPRRIYKYGEWSGEFDAQVSTADVKQHLIAYFPDLSQADAHETKLADGTIEMTFVKRAGTKGMDPISVAEVRARLLTIPPLELDAVKLLVELESTPPEATRIVALQAELDRAAEELDQHARQTQKVIKQCKALPAIPSRHLPIGF